MTADRLYQVHIAATPEAAWAALAEPDQVRRYYFDTTVRTTWEAGSPIDFVSDDGKVAMTGVITSYEAPRSFAHTFIAMWGDEPDDQGTLTWTVEPDGDGVLVTLVHAGGSGAETADGSRDLVDALKQYLESR
ncbi:hypothetical protein BH10ACT7_BH10ACT7_20970 [soil metagenome]